MLKACNRIIEYSFYGIFLLVPLAFTSATSELFELNKMWLTWALTIIIATAWFTKMILQKKFFIQRTPLDIPIGAFLVSQIISSIFSLDVHTSFWGYYSRFNGGLFSIISYILLYYAFLSNFQENAVTMVKKSLFLSLICGLIVALWGLPSHFGYDPTCLLFRGTFDVSCWTADFLPKVRIFSTLGQPDWLAAYLAILIPISIAYFLNKQKSLIINHLSLILIALFYVDLLYTRARSGFLGISFALLFFFGAYLWVKKKETKFSFSIESLKSPLSILVLGFLLITFVIGSPIAGLNKFTLDGIVRRFQTTQIQKTQPSQSGGPARNASQSDAGGTKSEDIRLLVWEGAINAWKANPIFGTGVETFAFAYYKYKPVGQNLTSEWNFLYNKAHNEYLNYLATTGIVGLGTYLGMIITFFVLCIKYYVSSIKKGILITALLASYISILVTNFFGFSVVMTNIYLFMIPAFVFILNGTLTDNKSEIKNNEPSNLYQWSAVFFIFIACFFLLISLFRFWQADIAFALGYNLDRAGEYQQAYPHLHKAVELRGGEPVFKDELSLDDAVIATGLVSQKSEDPNTREKTISIASSLTQEAINTSNEIISQNSNNTVFWKTRVRLFYTLSQVDPRYLPRALDAIEKASLLAPNDANIWYNLGVIYGQNNDIAKAIEAMEKTVTLKPDYRDAHYALGLFYRTQSLDKSGKVVADEDLNKKAITQMQYILEHINPQDSAAKESIKSWGN